MMKNLSRVFVLSLATAQISFAQTQPASAPAVLMVSLDGMRADYLSDADRYGLKLPVLRRLVSEGLAARRMISVYPSVTYPAHTALITGCRPAAHGILSNEPFQPLQDSRLDWYWFDRDIRATTLHGAFKQAGRSTAAVSWPVTVGAKSIDYLVPEYWDAADFEGSFLTKLQAESTPSLIDAARQRFNFALDLSHLDEMKTFVARHIVLAHHPDLLLLHLADLDKQEHHYGPGSPEALAALEKDDRLVGELLDSYREAGLASRLLVAVVSDHGFEAVSQAFAPNAVLREADLIDYDSEHKTIRSWKAKAWVNGGSASIMLVDPKDQAVLKQVRDAFAPYVQKATGSSSQPAAEPSPTAQPIQRIFEPAELARLGTAPHAAFMLDPVKGFTFSNTAAGAAIRPSTVKGMHGQFPERPELAAVFILSGPGIPRGKTLAKVDMIDVAPTLARLAGIELPGTQGHPIPINDKDTGGRP